MIERSAEEIVHKAIEKNELDLLLLGKPEYQYRSRWSSAPGDTDLAELTPVLYRGDTGLYSREQLRDYLHNAIQKIINLYEGLDAVAHCILHESAEQSPVDWFGEPHQPNPLGLPLDDIAGELRQSIRVFSFRLEKDKTGVGSRWPDGRLGHLRQLSRSTERLGGPAFCD
jgi:hypothetical protein